MKKVDVLYIHPTRSLDNTFYSFMPMGIFALINMLISNGYTAYGINYGIEKSIDKDYSLVNDIKNIDYKVIMIDLHWYEHAYGAIEIANISKEINPSAPVIMGGLTSTIYSKEILENFNNVDYLLKGDSEKPLLDLMSFLINNKGSLNDIENITYREKDLVIDKELTIQSVKDLEKLEPYGEANKCPLFLYKNLKVDSIRSSLNSGFLVLGNCFPVLILLGGVTTLKNRTREFFAPAISFAGKVREGYDRLNNITLGDVYNGIKKEISMLSLDKDVRKYVKMPVADLRSELAKELSA